MRGESDLADGRSGEKSPAASGVALAALADVQAAASLVVKTNDLAAALDQAIDRAMQPPGDSPEGRKARKPSVRWRRKSTACSSVWKRAGTPTAIACPAKTPPTRGRCGRLWRCCRCRWRPARRGSGFGSGTTRSCRWWRRGRLRSSLLSAVRPMRKARLPRRRPAR